MHGVWDGNDSGAAEQSGRGIRPSSKFRGGAPMVWSRWREVANWTFFLGVSGLAIASALWELWQVWQ